MTKEYHLREHPIQLFSVMMRGTKGMLIMGTFFGKCMKRALSSQCEACWHRHGHHAVALHYLTKMLSNVHAGVLRGLRCNLCDNILARDSPFLPGAAGAAV